MGSLCGGHVTKQWHINTLGCRLFEMFSNTKTIKKLKNQKIFDYTQTNSPTWATVPSALSQTNCLAWAIELRFQEFSRIPIRYLAKRARQSERPILNFPLQVQKLSFLSLANRLIESPHTSLERRRFPRSSCSIQSTYCRTERARAGLEPPHWNQN